MHNVPIRYIKYFIKQIRKVKYRKINKKFGRNARKIRKQFQKKKTTGIFPSRLCVIDAYRNTVGS